MNNLFKRQIEIFRSLDRVKKVAIIATFLFLMMFCFIHIMLVRDTFFVDNAGNINSTLEGYGDIPLHMTQISKFAFDKSFNLDEPIYFGRDLQYHFLFNLLRGKLLSLTNSWSFAVLWPVYILVTANIILIFMIYYRLIKNLWLSVCSMLLFYLGAGTAGWAVLLGEKMKIITKLTAEYPQQNVVFGPVMSMSFIHQQTFIFGFSVFLILILLIDKLQNKFNWKIASVGIITLGIIPVAHMHSFIAIIIFAFVSFVFAFKNKQTNYQKNILKVFVPGFILALPSIYFLTASQNGSTDSPLRFHLGWMVERGIGSANFVTEAGRGLFSLDYLSFLFTNFGLIIPIVLAVFVYFVIKYRTSYDQTLRNLYPYLWTSIIIFALINLIQFQTWDYDNNKLLAYSLFFASPLVFWILGNVGKNRIILKRILIGLILTSFILSGLVDIIFRLNVKRNSLYQIFSKDSVLVAEYIKDKIQEDDLILTSLSHTNPVVSLSGRQIVAGYTGWLWSRGINYQSREKAIKDFYALPSRESSLLKEYNIKYILLDRSIAGNFIENTKKFDRLFDREFVSGENVLYRVRE